MEESGDHSRRRSHRRRTSAPVSVDPITLEEFHFEALSRRRRRRRRSGTRSQSQASSSAAPPVGGGAADPEPPRRPHGITRLDPADGDGSLRGPFTRDSANDNDLWLPGNTNWSSSSSAAPHPDRPGAEGRTHVRQSVLYSGRPRHSRFRRQERAQEHATALSSAELRSPVLNLPTSEALPLSDPPHSTPETAEEIYDDELGRAVKDLPAFEMLSLSDNTLLTPQPAEEFDDCYDELVGDVGRRDLLSVGDSNLTTLSDMDQPRPDSDDDSEEFLRELQEYLDAFPRGSLRQTFDRLVEIEHATLTALAAKWGTEPPTPLEPPREPFPVNQKAQSVQVPEQASDVAAHARHGVVPRESRPEASMEETIRNGKIWMNKEVMLCFEKHIERSAHLVGLKDYYLDELLHQCFSMESYNKVYHHYNFTVKMKMPSSDDWVVELYFAEVKEMFGRKYYFCCPLEPDENDCCYACQSQGVEDLKHPAIGVFSKGSLDAPGFGLWYTDE